MRHVSLFSGIEAATAALERAGVHALSIAFSEVDRAADAVLRERWPEVPRVGDINGFDWLALRGRVDLVTGGPPCQSYSTAGMRLGSYDPRGGLIFDALRAIGAIQPRWFVLENVPGLLSANEGRDFARLLDEVGDLGFACAWNVLDAAHFGLPQSRRRLWIVGEHRGDGNGPESVLGLAPGSGRAALQGRAAWQTPARRTPGRFGTPRSEMSQDGRERAGRDGGDRTAQQVALCGGMPLPAGLGHNRPTLPVLAVNLRNGTVGTVCPTLMTKANSLNSNPCLLQERDASFALRRMTPRECLRLQGFDDDWLDGATLDGKKLSDTVRYRLTGNSWAVPVAAWILERIAARIEMPARSQGETTPAREHS